ncbi:sugar transferase [Flexivirga oryzae]|uniref:Exopolysaccharide biosynthesis polyprenyl glycosylphosphotransferase n=1 Tax=Flexivirga oryzae TaxID=1794944 RepID=A0A839N4I7_9MICO|nr:sugar transferase [Flexivirga oryzae]MBB2890135.1 exopolysaccharide biosynthesis polyprenyl glycosylphosphotransferase [Flexivirga oryzae]
MTSNVDASLVQVATRQGDVGVWQPEVGLARSVDSAWPLAGRTSDWTRSYVFAAVISDAMCALMCGAVAVVVSGAAPLHHQFPVPYLVILLLSPFAWVAMVAACHGYERRFLGVGAEEYRALVSAAVRLLALSAFVSYALYTGRPYLSRFFVLVYFPALLGAALLARYVLRKRLHRARARGVACHRAVVVGRDHAVEDLINDLHRDSAHGLSAVAVCTEALDHVGGVRREGSVRDAVEVARRCAADVVVVASPSDLDGIALRRLSWELDDLGIELIVSPGVVEVTGPRMSVRPAANLSLLHIERPALRGLHALTKTVFDRLVAGLLILGLTPVLLVVALLIKCRDGGAVFFRQTRVGIDGQDFTMLKFRSMVPNAEARLAELRADADDGNGVLFKLRDDPRVTAIGKVLRRYSLDELPQLINVIRGDMSIVGPRPPLRSEVDEYGSDAVRRLRVKPGLTGLWQVSGRSDLSWDESLRLDLRYVDNWSMLLDLQILWRTTRAVLGGAGAY